MNSTNVTNPVATFDVNVSETSMLYVVEESPVTIYLYNIS
jgi:hypothetical protein